MTLAAIKQILGAGGFIDDPADMAPYLSEWRDRWSGTTSLVARPRTVDQVATVVRCCAESGIPIVPQGGHTGLWGGAMPDPDVSEIILSLERLNQITDVDRSGYALTAQAGCTLAEVQQAAADAGLLFPLSLASEGTAQIGGILSTNAGGNAVLRYGSARQLALGLQVVLPSGDVWDGLTSLGKDNTGYDLKQLFIGAEGTLGIITTAVLKLFPQPRQTVTALAGLETVEDAIALLELMRDPTGDQLSAFELISRRGLEFVVNHMDRCRDPLPSPSPWYVLMEATSSQSGDHLANSMETALVTATSRTVIVDAVLAQSEVQRDDLWRLRDNLSEAQKFEGGSIKHDISVPIRSIPRFIASASDAVEQFIPGIRPVPFGHLGDGNIHFNLSQPLDMDREMFLARWEDVNRIVHKIVVDLEGSISAEHGIGQLKVDELPLYKSSIEINMMHKIKDALDPKNIMNPGKILANGHRR